MKVNVRKTYRKIKGCPFCTESILETSFLESPRFLVIYNQAPILPGHSLIIPKYHIESLFELNEDELSEFISLGQQAGKVLAKAFSTQSFNWSIQEKPAAGQTVPHLHMHVIPRIQGDMKDPGDWYPALEESFYSRQIDSKHRSKLSQEQLIEIATMLKTYL